jgi:hypothetical protein
VELSIPYTLVGPDGTRVVFGNSDVAKADPDWVGYLDAENGITGLMDGADVRSQPVDVVAGDGIDLGPSFMGARPGTIQIVVNPNAASVAAMEALIAKTKRASRALRADALLTWTPTVDGIQRMMRLRRTGKPSVAGRRPKTIQLAMTSPDVDVLAAVESNIQLQPGQQAGELGISDPITDPITSPLNVTAQQMAINLGDVETWPRFRITGPITNPELLNQTTGQRIRLTYTLGAGEYLDVYPERGQILLGGTADRYGALDFDVSDWWQLVPGPNDVRLLAAAYAAGANVNIYWRHAWE